MPDKLRELKELTLPELVEKETQYREEHYNLRFQTLTGQLVNPSRLREARRTLARVKTLIREKEVKERQ